MQPRRLSSFQFHRGSSPAPPELHPLTREETSRDPLDASGSTRHASAPTSLEPIEDGASSHVSGGSQNSDGSNGRRNRSSTSYSAPSVIFLTKALTGSGSSGVQVDETLHEEAPDEEAFVGSFEVLQEWGSVAADRAAKREVMLQRKLKEGEARAKETPIDAVYAKLLRCVDAPSPTLWERIIAPLRKRSDHMSQFLKPSPLSKFPTPNKQELIDLAKHCYPPRFDCQALVFDFGDNKTHYQTVDVRDVEFYWQSKPDWSHVRWIHAPFGRGITHSSVEDLFLHAHQVRRPYTNSGESVWPFLQTEILNFRSTYDFKRMRDVYLLLSQHPELKSELNASTFGDKAKGHLKDDMTWRAAFVGSTLDFWDLAQTDMPFELSEGGGLSEAMMTMYHYCLLGPRHGLAKIQREKELEAEQEKRRHNQALAKHPYFYGSQLVRNDIRAFHGGDGYLLTMSAAGGVDFLDQEFQHYLNVPREHLMQNPSATCIGRLADRFKVSGCKNWHRKTAEWLLVYLITEFGTTPNPFNGGMVAPTLSEAYQAVVLDLNRRRYDPWQKNETISLVRDMLNCVDELSVLVSINAKKIKLFNGLIQDCKNMESQDLQHGSMPDNPGSESAVVRAQTALRITYESHHCYTRLLSDLKESLNALFQLRSIEQDELAKLADKQNRAVVIFTAVTIVFLPLSFFTSYFGMNLRDLTDNEKTQSYFWRVCGSTALVLVCLVLAFAYKHHLKSHLTAKYKHY